MTTGNGEEEDTYSLFKVTTPSSEPITLQLAINNVQVMMEVDTGASVSIISEGTYQRIQQRGEAIELQKSTVQLKTYTGESIEIRGMATVKVRYADREEGLFVYVVHGAGPNLMGRD